MASSTTGGNTSSVWTRRWWSDRRSIDMPKDYSLATTPANEQRRPEYACDDEWTRAFLGRARLGHVATRWDDQPFLTPTTFWYDSEQRAIYFHSNLVGRVRANSERHE